jgi:flavin-dependent dehydrogenase
MVCRDTLWVMTHTDLDTGDFDAIVLGAGTAGAATALHLARHSFSVALIDHRAPSKAGARWVNGVPLWMFDAAGIDRPRSPELRAHGAFVVHGVGGHQHIRLDAAPVHPVDMRLLVERLHAEAVQEGVTLLAPAHMLSLSHDADGRPVALELAHGGRRRTLRAALFVDASGLGAALRARTPALGMHCPPVPRQHLCSAAQAVHTVGDLAGARAALDAAGAHLGDVICTLGLDGGYSTANYAVDAHGHVDLLAGAIAEPGRRSGPAILAGLRKQHPWIGERVFGGAGAIPLRRPYDRLTAPGLALVGNAACQVFAAHGSGIGIGMIAARMLAEAVSGYEDPGSAKALWGYQARFHRKWGGLLAGYDLFRRATQALTGEEADQLMHAGLVTPENMHAALDERLVLPQLGELFQLGGGALKRPRLTARFAHTMPRLPLLLAHYRRYPARPDLAALRKWSRTVARLFAEAPDLG